MFIRVISANVVFSEIRAALVHTLKTRYKNIKHKLEIKKEKSNTVYILFDIPNYKGLIPKTYIVYQFEQTSTSPWFTDRYMTILRNAYQVWDYSKVNIKWLTEQDITTCVHVPYCYSDVLDYYRSDDDQAIDVLFYGAMNERRERILKAISAKGLKVVVCTKPFYGIERDELNCKAKIVLNIHFYKPGILQTSRLVPLISNSIFCVSEPCDREQETNVEYKSYCILACEEELPSVCLEWCSKGPSSRQAFAKKAYELFKKTKMESVFPWTEVNLENLSIHQPLNILNQ